MTEYDKQRRQLQQKVFVNNEGQRVVYFETDLDQPARELTQLIQYSALGFIGLGVSDGTVIFTTANTKVRGHSNLQSIRGTLMPEDFVTIEFQRPGGNRRAYLGVYAKYSSDEVLVRKTVEFVCRSWPPDMQDIGLLVQFNHPDYPIEQNRTKEFPEKTVAEYIRNHNIK